ncbi:MAG: NADPH-dependent F420 reductase [Candidatus Kapabacteria bacterium]|jgi:predicted dinucleotide-binding enzyme|nr:NADPH-dependent F420 reductase [Candidatus Kapabacteria bacterium]
MIIAIVGKGNVGTALGTSLERCGHTIRYAERGDVTAQATGADVVIVAASPAGTTEIAQALLPVSDGLVVIDAMNSVSMKPEGYATSTHGFQALLPKAHVAKCFNTVGYEVMANPSFGDLRATMFMAGDDATAKAMAKRLALDIGFGSCEDVGGSNRFETIEHLALVWISLAMMQGKGRRFAWHLLER